MIATLKRYFPIAIVAAMILGSGYAHAVWTDRWTVSPAVQNSVKRLSKVPHRLGTWEGSDREMDPRQLAQAGAVGHVARTFENSSDQSKVMVLLMCGRAGPMSVHSPDICYRGAGFVLDGQPAQYLVPFEPKGRTAEVMRANFTKQDGAETQRLRIYWTWLGKDRWQAPNSPRGHFSGQTALYKLYVIREFTQPEAKVDEEACQDFLQRLFPALDTALLGKN